MIILYSLQLTVRASDPYGKYRDCDISISVSRDENPPVFINRPYKVKICDDQPLNTTFFSVTALDRDLQVRFYLVVFRIFYLNV